MWLPLLIIVVLLLGIGVIFCTPKSIFKQSINDIYNQSINRIDETDKLLTLPELSDGNL